MLGLYAERFDDGRETIVIKFSLIAILLALVSVQVTYELGRTDCDTDSECAALPRCYLKPGCDGGPNTNPW